MIPDIAKARRLICFVLATAVLAACGSRTHPAARASILTIHESDAGRTVSANVGQTIVIRLSSNRSTGYRWLLEPASGVLETLSDATYTPNKPGAVGIGGIESWSFRALHEGQETLRFEYRRPWESGVQAAKTLSFPIAVR